MSEDKINGICPSCRREGFLEIETRTIHGEFVGGQITCHSCEKTWELCSFTKSPFAKPMCNTCKYPPIAVESDCGKDWICLECGKELSLEDMDEYEELGIGDGHEGIMQWFHRRAIRNEKVENGSRIKFRRRGRRDPFSATPNQEARRTVTEEEWAEIRKILQEGERLRSSGKVFEAIEFYENAIARFPGVPNLIYNLGTCYAVLKDLGHAIQCFEEALEIAPDYPYAWLGLGAAYHFIEKDYKKAALCYKKCIECGKKKLAEIALKRLSEIEH